MGWFEGLRLQRGRQECDQWCDRTFYRYHDKCKINRAVLFFSLSLSLSSPFVFFWWDGSNDESTRMVTKLLTASLYYVPTILFYLTLPGPAWTAILRIRDYGIRKRDRGGRSFPKSQWISRRIDACVPELWASYRDRTRRFIYSEDLSRKSAGTCVKAIALYRTRIISFYLVSRFPQRKNILALAKIMFVFGFSCDSLILL